MRTGGRGGPPGYSHSMDSQPPTPPDSPTGAGLINDLPVRGADMVDTVVELLRDKTVRPLTLATRAIVFGIIVFAASVVILVLVSIAVIRLLTVYVFDGRVWLSQLVVGAVFVVAGLVAWSQRTASGPEPDAGAGGTA